jgi:hypothetical protein
MQQIINRHTMLCYILTECYVVQNIHFKHKTDALHTDETPHMTQEIMG